ncbi:hypothetical protein AGDE_13270 [Angomonas deanei]|nr:hypothetical protein AGDE_13270 [Angomonas deanei]|eukprot:EPY22494.1 hypothetical protein AGDE_13270 [Angomonas deanei]
MAKVVKDIVEAARTGNNLYGSFVTFDAVFKRKYMQPPYDRFPEAMTLLFQLLDEAALPFLSVEVYTKVNDMLFTLLDKYFFAEGRDRFSFLSDVHQDCLHEWRRRIHDALSEQEKNNGHNENGILKFAECSLLFEKHIFARLREAQKNKANLPPLSEGDRRAWREAEADYLMPLQKFLVACASSPPSPQTERTPLLQFLAQAVAAGEGRGGPLDYCDLVQRVVPPGEGQQALHRLYLQCLLLYASHPEERKTAKATIPPSALLPADWGIPVPSAQQRAKYTLEGLTDRNPTMEEGDAILRDYLQKFVLVWTLSPPKEGTEESPCRTVPQSEAYTNVVKALYEWTLDRLQRSGAASAVVRECEELYSIMRLL